jgi:hypothetical protein
MAQARLSCQALVKALDFPTICKNKNPGMTAVQVGDR